MSTHNTSSLPTPVNTGTLDSALQAIANRGQTAAQKRTLFPTKMAKPKFKMPSRFGITGLDFTHNLRRANDYLVLVS